VRDVDPNDLSAAIAEIAREAHDDGTIRLSAGKCAFIFRQLQPGALHITIIGDDVGQFGSTTVDEVAGELARFGKPLALYFDLRKTQGPATAVMEMWTEWFANHRNNLRRVVLLVPPESRVLHLSVSIAQHLSRTGNLIRICGDVSEFDRLIAADPTGSAD
jgi:hypothetical protein